METLVLRVVLPSLTVLLAGWVQQRLGPRHSGRLIGLPLTSGPFLAVLLLIEGPGLTVTAARGVASGQLMVAAFAATYAVLTVAGRRPLGALLGGTLAVTLLGAATYAWLPWHAALVVPIVAALALVVWRPEPEQQSATQARTSAAGGAAAVRELIARGALTGGLVGGLSLAAPFFGASLAGLLASIPLVIAVLAPTAHARTGAVAARTLLRGTLAVVPGTTFFALVVATALPVCEPVVAFGLALSALLTVNWLVGAADGATQRLRMP